ncbi:FAD-dependent oxidoreductase [Ralstonia solanacearum]|nr:FAD-dependent oxidoreductase [Ralstonia solanacearum]
MPPDRIGSDRGCFHGGASMIARRVLSPSSTHRLTAFLDPSRIHAMKAPGQGQSRGKRQGGPAAGPIDVRPGSAAIRSVRPHLPAREQVRKLAAGPTRCMGQVLRRDRSSFDIGEAPSMLFALAGTGGRAAVMAKASRCAAPIKKNHGLRTTQATPRIPKCSDRDKDKPRPSPTAIDRIVSGALSGRRIRLGNA